MSATLETISKIVNIVFKKKFNWHSRTANAKHALKKLEEETIKYGLTLDDMALASVNYARDITDYNQVLFSNDDTKNSKSFIEYNGMPFLICTTTGNTTWIYFRCKAKTDIYVDADCLKLISCLGLVKIYFAENYDGSISYQLPDNVIHIENYTNTTFIPLGQELIFPKYLRSFYYKTNSNENYSINYVNLLPSTVQYLKVPTIDIKNPPIDLKTIEYDSSNIYEEPNLELLPIHIKEIIINRTSLKKTHYTFSNPIKYMECSIGITNGSALIFENIDTLVIRKYNKNIAICSKLVDTLSEYNNLILTEQTNYCYCGDSECLENHYEEKKDIILSGLCNQLVLFYGYGCSTDVICKVKEIPPTFMKLIIIIEEYDTENMLNLKNIFNDESTNDLISKRNADNGYLPYEIKRKYVYFRKELIKFHNSFPNVHISFIINDKSNNIQKNILNTPYADFQPS